MLGELQSQPGYFGAVNILFPRPGIESRFVNHPADKIITIVTELSHTTSNPINLMCLSHAL